VWRRHRLQVPHEGVSESVLRTTSVLFVEDDDDLREMFVALVDVVLERRCVAAGSYHELVSLGDQALQCGVAILDINLGPNRPSGIDAYAWLRQNGFTGRIVFLTGHASHHPLVVEAQRIGDAVILSKPVDPDRLRNVVEGGFQ
jgi:FixJ family two-component response regulator